MDVPKRESVADMDFHVPVTLSMSEGNQPLKHHLSRLTFDYWFAVCVCSTAIMLMINRTKICDRQSRARDVHSPLSLSLVPGWYVIANRLSANLASRSRTWCRRLAREKMISLMVRHHHYRAGQNNRKVVKGRDAKYGTSVTVFRGGSSSSKENKQMLSNRRRRPATCHSDIQSVTETPRALAN